MLTVHLDCIQGKRPDGDVQIRTARVRTVTRVSWTRSICIQWSGNPCFSAPRKPGMGLDLVCTFRDDCEAFRETSAPTWRSFPELSQPLRPHHREVRATGDNYFFLASSQAESDLFYVSSPPGTRVATNLPPRTQWNLRLQYPFLFSE